MTLIDRQYRHIYGDMLLTFILFGTANTIMGSVLPGVLKEFNWSYSEAGLVMGASSIGYLISTVALGYLVKKLGIRIILVSCLVLTGTANLVFGLSGSVLFNLVLYLLSGIGQGGLEVAVNTSVVHMERKNESHLMGFVHAGFSIGAVTGPVLAGALLAMGGTWQLMFRAIGALFLASAVIPFFLPFDRINDGKTVAAPEPAEARQAAGGKPARNRTGLQFGAGALPVIVLGAITIFLYVGTEIGISNWTSEYFVNRFGIALKQASLVVALYWGGILAGRIAIPLLARRVPLNTQLVILAAVSAVSVFSISFLPGPVPASVGMFIAGLGCSSIYPLVMSLVGTYLSDNKSLGLGIVGMGGGLGSFSFPYIMALISERVGIITGFGFFAVTGTLLAVSSLVLFFRVRSTTRVAN